MLFTNLFLFMAIAYVHSLIIKMFTPYCMEINLWLASLALSFLYTAAIYELYIITLPTDLIDNLCGVITYYVMVLMIKVGLSFIDINRNNDILMTITIILIVTVHAITWINIIITNQED